MLAQLRTGASSARQRFQRALTSLCAAAALVACGAGGGDAAPDVDVQLRFDPPPRVGETTCTLTLSGSDGAPLDGAAIEVEGNMNHAGMVPVFRTLESSGDGAYASGFEFTMGGDWYVVVRGELADGRALERVFDVPAVPADGEGAESSQPVAR